MHRQHHEEQSNAKKQQQLFIRALKENPIILSGDGITLLLYLGNRSSQGNWILQVLSLLQLQLYIGYVRDHGHGPGDP